MSITPGRPNLSTVLSRTEEALAAEQVQAVVAKVAKTAVENVELKRLQRDQRYAAAVNIVAQARAHSGRDPLIATPEDANIINMIYSLLQKVADQPVPEPDKIFSNIPGLTTPSILELVVATCASGTSPSEQKGSDESRPSNDQPASTENSGG